MSARPRYTLRPVTAPVPGRSGNGTSGEPEPKGSAAERGAADPFLRPAKEDDDGYDPYSDRPPTPEPAYQEDPWR